MSAASTHAFRLDDEIFEDLSAKFPELVEPPYEGLVKLNEEWMKSNEGKKRWRDFIEAYKDKIKDYNFGSLIRTDANDEYSEKNTIFGEYLPICAYTRRYTKCWVPISVHRMQVCYMFRRTWFFLMLRIDLSQFCAIEVR